MINVNSNPINNKVNNIKSNFKEEFIMISTFKKTVAFVLAMVIMFGGCVSSVTVNAAKSNKLKMPTGDLAAAKVIEASGNPLLKKSSLKSTTRSLKSSSVNQRVWSKYSNDYAENKLNSYEKGLYNNLDDVCYDYLVDSSLNATYNPIYSGYYLPGAEYSNLTSDEVGRVIELFIYAHPQYYFTAVHYIRYSSSVCLYCYDEFAYGEDRAQVTNAVFDKLDKYVATAKKATDVEKTAHDLICKNVSYQSGTYDQSMYSALMEGKTVCAGYSQTLSAILNACGMETVLAYSKGHAWNKVKTNDGWRAVDSTWDDQGSTIVYYWYNKSDSDIRYKDTQYDHYIKADVAWYLPAATKSSKTANTERTTTTDSADSNKLETPVIKSLKAGSNKSMTLTFEPVSNTANYEIKISKHSKFKNDVHTVTVDNRYSAITFTKLTKNKRYYTKVRQVRKSGNKTYYSKWSSVKSVFIKK